MKSFLRCWWVSLRYTPMFGGLEFPPYIFCLLGVMASLVAALFGVTDGRPGWEQWEYKNFPLLMLLFTFAALVAFAASLYGALEAFIAIDRFRTRFGFLPPLTAANRDVLQPFVTEILRRKAINLSCLYQEEERQWADLRSQGHRGAEVDITEAPHVAEELEGFRMSIELGKRRARREFYGLRSAASAKYLPQSFQVDKSYKDYLPAEAAAKR